MTWMERMRHRLTQDPRMARVLHGSVSGLFGRGLTLVISAVTLPLTLHHLGKLEYGIWVTVSTSVAMLSVLDLGISNTLTSFIAEANAEGDQQKAQQYFATALWVTVGIMALLAPACYAVWRMVNWASLFHLADPVHILHARYCVGIAVMFFLVSLPLGLANRVLIGYQQVHVTNYFNMANGVLGLLAILVTIALKGSLVYLTASFCVAMILGTAVLNVWMCVWQRPWIRPSPLKVDVRIVRRLFGQGFLFFVLQLTGLVVFNSDNLVITHYLGASEVTPYSIAWRLTNYASMLQALLVPSLWPAFTEAYKKGQLDWVRSTYEATNRRTLTAVSVAALGIALLGRPIIRVWAGAGAVPSAGLLWLMAGFAVLISTTTNQALLLTATGRLRLEATVAVLAAVANLLLSIHLVQRIGAVGVILSTILSFLIFMVVPQAWEVRRVLAGRYMTTPEASEVAVVL